MRAPSEKIGLQRDQTGITQFLRSCKSGLGVDKIQAFDMREPDEILERSLPQSMIFSTRCYKWHRLSVFISVVAEFVEDYLAFIKVVSSCLCSAEGVKLI